MGDTEHAADRALPLVDAAAHLGITTDALRMRLRRGKARGFKRDRHVYVYLTEQDLAAFRAGAGSTPSGAEIPETEVQAPASERSPRPERTRRARARSPAATPEAADQQLPEVAEFQKIELTRLLRENERLNSRLDLLLEESRHMRQMQQREQILRQHDQNLRQQLHATLDKLTDALALPRLAVPRLGTTAPESEPNDIGPPDSGPRDWDPPDREPTPEGDFQPESSDPKEPRVEAGASRSGAPGNGASEDPIQADPPAAADKPAPAAKGRAKTGRVEPKPNAPGATKSQDAPQDASQDAPRRAPLASKGARDRAADDSPAQSSPPTVSPSEAPVPPARDGSDFAERETEELADLLRSLGESLRDLDTAPALAPALVRPSPGSVADGASNPEPSDTNDPLLLHRRVPQSDLARHEPNRKAPLRGHSGQAPAKSQGKKSRFLKRLFGSRSDPPNPELPDRPIQGRDL